MTANPRIAIDAMAKSATANPRIAIDAMGGDIGPAVIVAGMSRARRKQASLRFELYGDENLIKPELAAHANLAGIVTV
ncbi:MAG: hypothetical protein V4696_11815, partial [Pseudomonadota bacterium]